MSWLAWSPEFCHEDLERYYNTAQEQLKKLNFNLLTEDELKFLGFRKYSDNSENYLVPLWLLRCLPEGTVLRCLSGRECVVGTDEIDNDVRYGLTAFSLIQH
ncbi:hypothetical protein BC351_00945 [Paenibacillus ferrarius]|uniref:Uncharacterized protein n=1 Tax=Paenibacillus ferrarius TaxID=1469647 RepID=A0A1V4HSB1_9BACL|nr:hypothetical protein BC351_00945 [Paenibacillus ferrarius]